MAEQHAQQLRSRIVKNKNSAVCVARPFEHTPNINDKITHIEDKYSEKTVK